MSAQVVPSRRAGAAVSRALRLLLAAVVWLAPGGAAAKEAPSIDTALLARIEAYLDGLTSLQARFVQLSEEDGRAGGTLYIRRPGRLRVDYDPPVPIQLYADGYWLVHVDNELEQANYIPLDRIPAGLLLRERISFGEEAAVRRLLRDGAQVHLDLVHRDSPDAGRLRLVFDAEPLRLRAWRVVDAQGGDTAVILVSPTFNAPIAPELFRFDRERFSPPRVDD